MTMKYVCTQDRFSYGTVGAQGEHGEKVVHGENYAGAASPTRRNVGRRRRAIEERCNIPSTGEQHYLLARTKQIGD